MSTATDLGAPTSEQGAGLINSLAAVRVALSIDDRNGDPKSYGPGLLSDLNALAITGAPNRHESHTFKVMNTGPAVRHLSASLQTLGAPVAGATYNLQLTPGADQSFVDVIGLTRAYVKQKFTVPVGVQHLDAAIAWQTATAALSRLTLLDPSGRMAAYSIPQGAGNGYGHVDVVHPAAGTWTAIIWTRDAATGYTGPVQFTWAAEDYVKFGSVYPSSFILAPGATQSITADFFLPTTPGDLAAALRFTEAPQDGTPPLPAIPVTLRSLVPVGGTGGAFSGTLTGGNARAGAGPTQTYAFDVPAGVNDLALAVQTADNGYLLTGFLIDPNGMQLSVKANLDPLGNSQYGLQLYHYNPQPGRWQFIFVQNFFSSGNQTSLPFTARIGFNTALTSATGLPNDPAVTLSASKGPVTATINVVNTGTTTEAFFADARLVQLGYYSLPGSACSTAKALPGVCEQFAVPTQTSNVKFVGAASAPITMDAASFVGVLYALTGSPDVFAKQTRKGTVTASLAEPEIPFGIWQASPSLIGPFGPNGAPTESVTVTAFALAEQFDSALTADSGDIWADGTFGTKTFAPLLVPSGAGGKIKLTLTPDPKQIGKTVSGYVYVDTFNSILGSGDEVVRIPYRYTVVK